MKKPIMIALAAVAVAMTGCKSIEVERNGQALATVQNADGTVQVVKDKDGNPIVLDGGWNVDYFQNANWQKFDALEATAGAATLRINNYASGMDWNLVALVDKSMEGATKLVVAVGEAYVQIAGGGAQADTTLTVANKVYKAFTSGVGDATKATVTTDAATNTVKVSDGSVCTTCTKDGTCTTGACAIP